MTRTFPKFSQWKQIFKILKRGEKITFLGFFLAGILSLGFLIIHVYATYTVAVPTLGGTYVEGVVGQPRFINPIYGETNDVDRSLMNLVFSGLLNYDKDGQIVKDLAKEYTISDDGKTYSFTLNDNIFWSDGKQLTTDDVIFTIKTIQNSDYKSPLRANWIDVEVNKISDKSLNLILKTPYNSFIENCTLKIMPEHIWASISPENFILSAYNLQPIGSGPYLFTGITQTNTGFIKTLNLTSNRRYYASPSFIENITFQFFEKREDLVRAVNGKLVDGFTLASLDNNQAQAEEEITQGWAQSEIFSVYSFSMPRYVAVFFNNQKTSLLTDINIRQALTYATDKEKLLQDIQDTTKTTVLNVTSPILPDFFSFKQPSTIYTFDIEKAKTLLDKSGFKETERGIREKAITKKAAFQFVSYLKVGSKGKEVTEMQACLARLDEEFKTLLQSETNGTFGKATDLAVTAFQVKYLPEAKPTGETGAGTRTKLNELCLAKTPNTQALTFTLVTANQPQLLKVANSLKDAWKNIGVDVVINAVSVTDLKPIIKNRTYDALLYGEALGAEPDFYPFWHSSQKLDPGLNLSSYENKDVDKLLKNSKEIMNAYAKEQELEKAQDIIVKEAPALFLYNPNYMYWVAEKVHGIDTTKIIDPAKRFSNITNWYTNTKRIWN